PAAIAAAEVHEAAVFQDDAVVAVVPGLDLADAVDVHDVAAVHPGEALLIQLLLKGDQGCPQGIGVALHEHCDVVAVRFDAIDVADAEDELPVELAYHQAFQLRRAPGWDDRTGATTAGIEPQAVDAERSETRHDDEVAHQILAVLVDPVGPPGTEVVAVAERRIDQLADTHH